MMRSESHLLLLCVLLAGLLAVACGRDKPLDAAALRGMSKEELQQMRQEILDRHGEGQSLSDRETALVEQIREQERRLDNAWIFGEWRERHGARLIFRDDGTVSVGARTGVYDELGVYKFISPEEPSFEAVWTLAYDPSGDPVAVVPQPDGGNFLYPFHRSRNAVYEQAGDWFRARLAKFGKGSGK